MVLCEYCKKDFKNNKTLLAHQKNAKYCIESREKIILTFKCKICGKILSSKQRLNTHILICNTKSIDIAILEEQNNTQKIQIQEQKEQIMELKLQIQELQNKLENIAVKAATRPTTTNNTMNTNIMNLAPLDMDELTNRITDVINNNMTTEHLIMGQEGVAKLIASCFTNTDGKKMISCTDISRGVWKSKDKNGNISRDYKATKIAKVVKPIATSKADKIIELDDEKRQKIYELKQIRRRKKDAIFADECDTAHMRGLKKDTSAYKMYEDRIQKRADMNAEDVIFEREIMEEFGEDRVNYLLTLEDDETPYKLILGKQDIQQLNDDSTKFSNSLVTCI